jgi:VWFA-related protein
MRKLAMYGFVVVMALPAFAGQRVTVTELEHVLSAARGSSDTEIARKLEDMELTERLSPAKLAHWRAGLPGEKAQQALLALADQSAFLDPPAADIPTTATPDLAEQRRIMTLTVDYLRKALPLLPSLFATRTTTRFLSKPSDLSESLHPVGRSSITVLYREGREKVEQETAKSKKPPLEERGLTSWGVFGPVLSTVMLDAGLNKLAWSRWENSPAGAVAVFQYSVPIEKSHYDIRYCCFTSAYGFEINLFHEFTGYHGEIAVDSSDGSILRLTLVADLKPEAPLSQAAIMVEYAPVEIGGQTYICPIRSVSLSKAQTAAKGQVQPPSAPAANTPGNSLLEASFVPSGISQVLLNDDSYEQYHLYRGELNIVTGEGTGTEQATNTAGKQAENAPSETVNSPSGATAAKAAQTEADTAALAAEAVPSGAVPAPAAAAAAVPAAPTDTEIAVTAAAGIPEAALHPRPATPDSGFILRTTSRLVDVGLVAYDKKGHPITDLKPGNLEIYDNGRKQQIKFFTDAAADATQPAAASAQAAPEQNQPAYANRPAAGDTRPGARPAESAATILLMDPSNLSFADLTISRNQVLRFIRALPPTERIALYTMNSRGFQVVAEGTTDHDLVETRLSKWMPSAQDVAQAQEAEQRNRQQFDEVHNVSDLTDVNGRIDLSPDTRIATLDPNLRDWGKTPASDALAILVGVARHLSALSGHKNLVWVASDNVLADWNNQSTSFTKTNKNIEPDVLRAQEAMNDAHVSVYPLDASQLGGGAADPSLYSQSIQLTPGAQELLAVRNSLSGLPACGLLGPGGIDPGVNSGMDVDTCPNSRIPGRPLAQMQQDLHPIQGAFRQLAEATGGRAFRRASDLTGELDTVVADGRAAYLVSFTPDQPADDKYHLLAVKLVGRRDVTLHYRTGYQYDKEPATLKDRFRQAIWQPADIAEIGLSANPIAESKGPKLVLNIAATDLDLAQQGKLLTDKVDIFVAQRDDAGLHAQVSGQTVNLRLIPATYEKLMRDGIPFEQPLESKPEITSVRVLVVDENSGLMGSVTVPTGAWGEKR